VRAGARSEQLSSSRATVNSLMCKFPLPAFAVTRARWFSFGGTPTQLVADEIAVHADDDLALAPSSICSSARTGTRNIRPILITGSSPRAAASYEAFRHNPKYFFPASGTEIVSEASSLIYGSFQSALHDHGVVRPHCVGPRGPIWTAMAFCQWGLVTPRRPRYLVPDHPWTRNDGPETK
jgi:hypothetical protein